MPWVKGRFFYSKALLCAITNNYRTLYFALPLNWKIEIYNPWELVEYKADLDRALNCLGRGHWTGNIDGCDLKSMSELQRVVISDIKGVSEYGNERLRNYAYFLMKLFLNEGENAVNYEHEKRVLKEVSRTRY